MTHPARLFGVDGWEHLHRDLDSAVEDYADRCCYDTDEHVVDIGEWSVVPPIQHLPTVEHVIEFVVENAAESGEVDEDYYDFADIAGRRLDVRAAFGFALGLLAHHVGYHMADRQVATHRVRVWFDGDVAHWETVPE